MSRVLAASAHSEQAEALSLMFVQIERKDMVLFEELRLYGRMPRPVFDDDVALDFGLFAVLREACAYFARFGHRFRAILGTRFTPSWAAISRMRAG